MERSVPDPKRPVRTHGNVFWFNQLPGNIPDDDEHHLPNGGSKRVAICIHGRYRHPHKTGTPRNRAATPGQALYPHPSRPGQARTAQPLPQTGKLRIQGKGN